MLAIWIGSAAMALAASSAFATVSVEEIVRLNSIGMSEQSLLLVVTASDTPDTLSTAQLTQMIEAQVPDTVIATMVAKADAVMEDWQPVDIDQALEQQKVYTETEVYNVYPGWGGYGGYPGYGWCGTPYYGWYDPWWGAYATPYAGFYVGFGWGGGWSFGFGWGGGYCGYYDPWYWGGGYCGYYDPWYGYGYDPYPYYPYDDHYSYREIDRPNYHNGADRGTQRGVTPTPYRQDPSTGTGTRSELSRLDTRQVASIDRSAKSNTGSKDVRSGTGESTPSSRSLDNLTRISSPKTEKSTLQTAEQGSGRYVIKGNDKTVKGDAFVSDSKLDSPGSKVTRSTSLEKGTSKANREVRPKVVTGVQEGLAKRDALARDKVADATRTLTREAKVAGGKTTSEKVNRYVQLKAAQNATGTSRASRSTASRATTAGRGSVTSKNSARLADRTPASTGQAAQKQTTSGNKSTATPRSSSSSASKQVSRSSGQRSAPSSGGFSRSGGGSFSGGGARSGGGGARSGGGSRGGGRAGR